MTEFASLRSKTYTCLTDCKDENKKTKRHEIVYLKRKT